jgi:hypothetical protein
MKSSNDEACLLLLLAALSFQFPPELYVLTMTIVKSAVIFLSGGTKKLGVWDSIVVKALCY